MEAYEPVLFSTFPELKVFDRLTGKFGVVLQQNSPDTLISADENAQDSNKTSVIPDDILLNTNEMLAVVTKYMSLLSNGKYIEAFEMLSLNTRQRDWNNNPLDFAAQYHFTFEINLLSISQVRARFDSYHQRPEAYCFVGYEQNVLSRTSDELKRLLFEDHKIELIVEFAKDVNSFIRLAEQSGINGLKDLSIRSLFSVEFVDLLLNFAKSNRAEYKALFPKDFELTVHQFVELDLSYENGEWWIEDHIPFNAGYYFENGFENDRSMRI
ncbi:hypothetical protein [Mucilaginibacter sp. SJ]|uniref:hypothetical protein n=1 Tax=Mucilaginibacter sp. SJ TaxID=3029053 RepID=UPI0023A94981|nr:hypothetical protein [Mucilaginibacter sp. SJ]WEA01818.1 hypothetical protein MusilaSJ_02630 [Mucilaginibacter sp. SJ]